LAFIVINLSNAFYTIPSLAIFGFLVPFLGVGIKPAIIALVLYGQFVLIGHTYTGVTGVDRAILEAGKAMGLTNRQILFSIQLPLGFPLIAAGIRTATTLTISIVVIGAWVGAGGLGVLMFRGIASSNWVIVLAGSIPVLVLSIVADILLSCAQPLFTPKGLRDR
jgi:osmoprotectant transport system permease protein